MSADSVAQTCRMRTSWSTLRTRLWGVGAGRRHGLGGVHRGALTASEDQCLRPSEGASRPQRAGDVDQPVGGTRVPQVIGTTTWRPQSCRAATAPDDPRCWASRSLARWGRPGWTRGEFDRS